MLTVIKKNLIRWVIIAMLLFVLTAFTLPSSTSIQPKIVSNPAEATPAPEDTFIRVAQGHIVSSGKMSRGVAWGDYNDDGKPDLFVANSQGQTNFLYRNDGDGIFTPVQESEIMQIRSYSESGNWVDYDSDGDLDLFITNIRNEANFLFRNDGDDSFTRITDGEIVSERRSSTGSCWADYDADGDLDVFVANRNEQHNSFFSNNGDGNFAKMTDGEIVKNGGDSRACGWADVDGDADLDLYVGNAHEANFFYTNNGDGTFTRVTEGSFTNDISYTYGLSWADVVNDGDIDLFVSNVQDKNILYLNNGLGEFERVVDEPFATDIGASKGNTWGDFDNDGDVDLFVANGTPDISDVTNFLYLNDGEGTFTRSAVGVLTDDNHISAGTAWVDYNNDGRLDIFVANWGNNNQDNALYTNENGEIGNWIKISLVGYESNRSSIGATVRLETIIDAETIWQTHQVLGNTGYGSQNEQIIHFGIGSATQIKSLEIRWQSGEVDVYTELIANTRYTATEAGDLHLTDSQ
ncbi:MAG: CRTAC1 family protein [Chloroflexi bacterium]|nr:CRTAC1 family protein [Chloroflexota bacterium]